MGVGAKYLGHQLSDVHIWRNSHYLMRQCGGVSVWGLGGGGGGENEAKAQIVQVQVKNQ